MSLLNSTIVFVDGAFLSKISKQLGKDVPFKYDLRSFIEDIAFTENLKAKQIFYYNSPPFQSQNPSEEENGRKERYDKFIRKLREKKIIVREGRCQRIKEGSKFVFNQKGVDMLLGLDLVSESVINKVKRIILIASDSDFVPAIERLKLLDVKVILYTFFEAGRNRIFSTSNELIKSVHKYKLIKKEDFEKCKID